MQDSFEENVQHLEAVSSRRGRRDEKPDLRRILVFSQDTDLAASLSMVLADGFSPVVETDLRNLQRRIRENAPALLLIDLCSTAAESIQQLRALEELHPSVPIVLLRQYRWFSEVDQLIKKLKAFYFFKPVDVEKVTGLITGLVGTRAATNKS